MKELTVLSKIENVTPVTAFIDEELEAHDCTMKAQMQIDVAVDELFGNIAYYAYAPNEGDVTVRVDFNENCVSITFIDSGMAYNPLEKDDPDITLSAEDRNVGGLGIFIVKNTMDDVSYRYEDGQNILTIVKTIA